MNDLFTNKNIINIFISVIVIFLSLPLIFPETSPVKIIKREIMFAHEDSPLPIFPKDNLVKKYLHRLKKFYKIEKENPTTPKETVQEIQEEELTAADLFFSDDYDDEDNIYLTGDTSVNLQKGTVITKSGLTLGPTQDGYYYNNGNITIYNVTGNIVIKMSGNSSLSCLEIGRAHV